MFHVLSLLFQIPDLWTSMPQLQTLILALNNLTGPLPASLGSLSATLVNVDLSDNPGLNGTIPDAWAPLFAGELDSIMINRCNLSGSLPVC